VIILVPPLVVEENEHWPMRRVPRDLLLAEMEQA